MVIGAPVAGTNAVNSVAATTLNVPYPASPLSSDLLVMRVTVNDTTAPTDPSGWTLVRFVTASGTVTPGVAVWIKQAAGGESGNLAVTTSNVTSQGRMYKVPGVDLSNPQDVTHDFISLGPTTAYTFAGVTTTMPGVCLFGLVGSNTSGSGTFTPPTVPAAFTELTDVNTVVHSSDAYLIWSGQGATGGVNFVRSGSVRGAGVLLALRPLAPFELLTPTPRYY